MADTAAIDILSFDSDGFACIEALIDADCCDSLAAEFETLQGAGVRHLIDHPSVRALLEHPHFVKLVTGVLGGASFAYKATLFDKRTEANWLVAWHQDISIPVSHQIDLDGWTTWSRKEDVWYVQPPTQVLSQLVAMRIHLDDCDDDNGPLRLLSGSHLFGRLKLTDIASHLGNYPEKTVIGRRGSALMMRPLLIHASSKATARARRRVLHLEFANFELPAGLDWHRRVPVGRQVTTKTPPLLRPQFKNP